MIIGNKVCLEKISDSRYELKGNFSFFRQITEAGKVIAVDPEGGPMICVGDHINKDFLVSGITLEDDRIILNLRNC